MADIDRNAILARRALFISAALTGLACTSHEPPPKPKPEPTSKDDEPGPDATGRQRPSWDEVMAAAPPLDAPEVTTGRERRQLQELRNRVRAKYEKLEAVWEITPDCPPTRSECVAWSKAVEAMLDAWPSDGPMCGHPPEWTDTLQQRARAHDHYLEQLRELLVADLATAAEGWSKADADSWQAMRETLELGPPRPCLSCARPDMYAVLVSVPFAADSATIGTDPVMLEALQRAREMIVDENGPDVRVFVRGHADAGEQDAERVARERAEAVATWLTAAGVAKHRLEVQSLGAKLPASRESKANRRVDFQIDVPSGAL